MEAAHKQKNLPLFRMFEHFRLLIRRLKGSCNGLDITLTSPCILVKTYKIQGKVGLQGVYIIFLILTTTHRLRVLLIPSHSSSSNKHTQPI